MAYPPTLKDVTPKLRIVKPKAPGEKTVSTTAYQTTRVTALDNGINLNRQDGGLIQYADISLLVAFQLDVDPDTWYIDLFVYGQPGSFRLSQKAINYRQFLPEISQRSKDNFYTFLLHLISQTDSVYVDQHTLDFLKSKKMTSYPDFKLAENHTSQLWHQIISWMKFQCDQCGEVYWVDETKVTAQGAKTKCVKCQNIITVQKRAKPMPLKSKEERKKISCPHCQYENPEGSQFCVMCQKPLTAIEPPPAPAEPDQIREAPSSERETPSARAQQETPPAKKEAFDLSGLPLQARGQKKPRLSFREIATSLQDDINTMQNKFAWFTQFSWIMKFLGSIFLVGGFLLGIYIRFVMKDPSLPEIPLTTDQRWTYAGIAFGVGILLSLASIITSNIIALTLEIERNTKITTLLLQKLVEKEEE
jgi:predicted Zn finger-like uncharacterized protein